MTQVRTPKWKRWGIVAPFAVAMMWSYFGLRPDPARAALTVAMLIQEGDSAQYAVTWGPATSTTHYRIYTGPDAGGWERELEVPDNGDYNATIWVPLEATVTLMFLCVEGINRQPAGVRRGTPACITYTAPAALSTPGTPGAPSVTLIPTVASRFDSITITPAALDIDVGEDTELRAFVWIADVPTICATMDNGEVGWMEVTFTDASRFDFTVPNPARYLEDPNCGELRWVSADPSVVTVTPNPPVDLGPDPVLIQAAR